LWLPCYSKGISNEGLRVVYRDHFAYYNYQRKQWDFASGVNFAYPPRDKNPWYHVQSTAEHELLVSDLRVLWLGLPQTAQRHVFFIGHIAYEDIKEVDDVPDTVLKVPTVFVTFRNQRPPFAKAWDIGFDRRRSRIDELTGIEDTAKFHKEGHVRLFPDKFRDLNWERDWYTKNHITYATEPHHLELTDKDSPMPIPE